MLTQLRVLAAKSRGMFSRHRDDAEFSDELRAHLDMLTEENVRRGLPLPKARRLLCLRCPKVTRLEDHFGNHGTLANTNDFRMGCRHGQPPPLPQNSGPFRNQTLNARL